MPGFAGPARSPVAVTRERAARSPTRRPGSIEVILFLVLADRSGSQWCKAAHLYSSGAFSSAVAMPVRFCILQLERAPSEMDRTPSGFSASAELWSRLMWSRLPFRTQLWRNFEHNLFLLLRAQDGLILRSRTVRAEAKARNAPRDRGFTVRPVRRPSSL